MLPPLQTKSHSIDKQTRAGILKDVNWRRGLGGCSNRRLEQEEHSCVAGVLQPISGGSASSTASSTASTSGGLCHWQH